jgi:hypothetical protein
MAHVVVLDSEMVHALGAAQSSKHRRALALAEVKAGARPGGVVLVVPSTVRVEAGWDRTRPRWAAINRLKITDHHLDQRSTDVAARLRADHDVSPADAHIGALVRGRTPGDDVVVVTSDPADIAKVTQRTGVRVVRI